MVTLIRFVKTLKNFSIFLTILLSCDVQQRRFVIEQRRAMRGRAIRIQVTRMRLSQKKNHCPRKLRHSAQDRKDPQYYLESNV